MPKFFRLVAGVKFYCDEKGLLFKNAESKFEEVPETDTTAKEVESSEAQDAIDEVAKMLKEATAEVTKDADGMLTRSTAKATTAMASLFEAISKMANKSTKVLEVTEQKASFDVEAVKKGIKDLSGNKISSFTFELKSKADLEYLAKTTSEGGFTGPVILPQRVPDVDRAPVRQVFIESIADVTPDMTSNQLSYVEVLTETGAPAITAELGLIPQKDWTFGEFHAPLEKITVMNKHSVEILKDAPQLVSAINGWLQQDMNIVVDNELLTGSGTGGHLPGIFGLASVLNSGAIGSKRVVAANLYDVIRVAITKIAVTGKGSYQANYVLLNPADADVLDLTKDANNQYVLPPFRSADGTMIKGVKIIENVGVTAGTFLVGDFRRLHIGTQGGIEVEMTNSDADDFAHDILSVKLRRRIAAYIRANDVGAFWTGNIATVIGVLTS